MSTAIWTKIAEKVQSLIQGLSLTGISTNVVLIKVPLARGITSASLTLPAAVVTYGGEKIIPKMNDSYDVEHTIHVIYVRKSNQDLSGSLDVPNQWRQDITRYFQSKTIVATLNLNTVYNCRVDPGVVLWEKGFEAQHDIGSLKIVVTSREPR